MLNFIQMLKSLRLCLFVSIGVFYLSCSVRAEILTIGTISADPIDEARTFQPFSEYLSAELSGIGVQSVQIKIANSIDHAVKMLKTKELDFFIDSSVTASHVNTLSGSRFLLRRWKKARDKYRSVIFVNADSPVTTLAELQGQTVAFEEQFSTSGYILPAVALLKSGQKLSPLSSFRTPAPADKVGFVMANDNETQIVWLERDKVAAAAMSESDFLKFSKDALKPMRIVYTTPYVPYHVISHRADLDQKYIDRVKEILLAAHQSGNGRKYLEAFERTTQFDEIPEELLSAVEELTSFVSALPASR